MDFIFAIICTEVHFISLSESPFETLREVPFETLTAHNATFEFLF